MAPPPKNDRPTDPTRRDLFKIGAGAVVAGKLPAGAVESAAGAAIAIPTTIAGRLGQLNTMHQTLRSVGLSSNLITAHLREETYGFHQRIAQQTGISWQSLHEYMVAVGTLEESLTHAKINPITYAATLLGTETLTRQNPKLVAAAQFAVALAEHEQRHFEDAGLEHVNAEGSAHRLLELGGIPKSLRADGDIKALIAKGWQHFDTKFLEARDTMSANDKSWLLRSDNPAPVSRDTVLQSALLELVPHSGKDYSFREFEISCPDGKHTSLKMAPIPSNIADHYGFQIAQNKAFESQYLTMKEQLQVRRQMEARKYLIEHPIDLSMLTPREALDMAHHLDARMRQEDCVEGQDPHCMAIARLHPEYFTGVHGALPAEPRAELLKSFTHGVQLFNGATTLAQVIAQLVAHRKQNAAKGQSVGEAGDYTSPDPMERLLLKHIRDVAPEGLIDFDYFKNTFTILDDGLREEVVREEAALPQREMDAEPEATIPLTRISEREPLAVERAAPTPSPDLIRQ